MKKPYVPTPVEELTEEQLKRGFQRLRELYEGEKHHVHEIKIERGKLRVLIDDLNREIKLLKRENRMLKEENEKLTRNSNKPIKEKKPKEEKKKVPVNDFKKKFFDSL